jgi:two-component system response regulator PfeR
MSRILVMEGEVKFLKQLTTALNQQGDEVEQCHDEVKCHEKVHTEMYDLIVLGLSISTAKSTVLLQCIRKSHNTPIIVLSPCNTSDIRIENLLEGADDYVAKPANLTEVILRINILLKRNREVVSNNGSLISVDRLTLNKTKQQVTFDGIDLMLTPLQFRLIWKLVANRNHIISKNYLYQAVLGRQYKMYDRSLEMHLSRIRKKLAAHGMATDRLATVHGKGYRFT